MSDPDIPDEVLVELGRVVHLAAQAELWLTLAAGLPPNDRLSPKKATKKLRSLADKEPDPTRAEGLRDLAELADERFDLRNALVHGIWGSQGDDSFVTLKPETDEKSDGMGLVRTEFNREDVRWLAADFRQINARANELGPPG